MSQENADDLNEIGSLSSGSLEPPAAESEDQEDNNEADGNNESPEGEQLSSIPADLRDQRTQATPVAPKTNVDKRLTEAQKSYTRDPSKQRSKDVGVLTTKFRQFRVHLNELKPIIKSYQEANKELHSARTQVSTKLNAQLLRCSSCER